MIGAIVIVAVIVVVTGILSGWFMADMRVGLLAALAMLIVSGLIAWPVSLGYSNPRDLTCHVEDKDRAGRDGGASDMRIYTTECGVLKVQDLLWALRFDSADVFASIEPGHTYKFHVTGIRAPFFSVFPNVRSAERVS